MSVQDFLLWCVCAVSLTFVVIMLAGSVGLL